MSWLVRSKGRRSPDHTRILRDMISTYAVNFSTSQREILADLLGVPLIRITSYCRFLRTARYPPCGEPFFTFLLRDVVLPALEMRTRGDLC